MKNKNILEVEVSCFKNYITTTNPETVTLCDWLNNDEHRQVVEAIRATDNPEKRKLLKSSLPAITPAGVFADRGTGAEPLQYSGIMCIDIDKHDNEHIENFDSLKTVLSNISNVAYCGLSVSGNGYFLLVPIAYPLKYEQHFDAFVEALSEIGINADKACRNVSRLRGYSIDDNAYFNSNAEVYRVLKFPPKPQRKPFEIKDASSKVDLLISKMCINNIDITADYKDWFAVGCAIASEYGENGRQKFHCISAKNSKYNTAKCDIQYNRCLRTYTGKGFTIASFFYFCKRCGLTVQKGGDELC